MDEVICLQKTEAVIKRDERNYELPHVYDDVILSVGFLTVRQVFLTRQCQILSEITF